MQIGNRVRATEQKFRKKHGREQTEGASQDPILDLLHELVDIFEVGMRLKKILNNICHAIL